MGTKGRNALAPSTLNMLPKFELAPMRMYLRMFAKTLRPSRMPSSSTIRLFSSRMRSADSLAMSAAESTEMPDVGRAQGGPVVDAVAEEAHHVALALQRGDDPLLVSGRQAREERRLLDGGGELRVGHRLDLGAEQDVGRPGCRRRGRPSC